MDTFSVLKSKLMRLPQLPKTAARVRSGIWAVFWFAYVNFSRYFLASDRNLTNDSVAKFWNSST